MGVHYGKMILGMIGEEHRLDDTVISDTVNTASRIESYAVRYPGVPAASIRKYVYEARLLAYVVPFPPT